jgi:hypothetical protein
MPRILLANLNKLAAPYVAERFKHLLREFIRKAGRYRSIARIATETFIVRADEKLTAFMNSKKRFARIIVVRSRTISPVAFRFYRGQVINSRNSPNTCDMCRCIFSSFGLD